MTSEAAIAVDWTAAPRGKPSLPMTGFLIVEIVIGYEWFISGLVKVVRGDFLAGLAEELLKRSAEMPSTFTWRTLAIIRGCCHRTRMTKASTSIASCQRYRCSSRR